MPDHEIRLRRAWSCRSEGGFHRLDLPAPIEELPDSLFTLERSYRFPRLEPNDTLHLQVRHSPGLVNIHVDDQHFLPTDPLPTAGRLSLLIDPIAARRGPDGPDGWGDIRFVVRTPQVADPRPNHVS